MGESFCSVVNVVRVENVRMWKLKKEMTVREYIGIPQVRDHFTLPLAYGVNRNFIRSPKRKNPQTCIGGFSKNLN